MPKTLLLTGIAGFAGSHALEHVMEHTDWNVIGLSTFRHYGDPLRLELDVFDPTRIKIYHCDLTSDVSERLIDRIGPIDYIWHLAAESHVDRSIEYPRHFIENNTSATITIMELARKLKPSVVIQISTDEVYGPASLDENFVEWSPIVPSNPYSASKACQEAVGISYWRTYGVPLVITNCWDMDTKIVTLDGWKGYEELEIGDPVLSVNDNGELTIEPILDKIKMSGPDQMVRISGRRIDNLFTPNHRVMFRKPHGSPRIYGEIEESHAEELVGMKNRIRIPASASWDGENDNDFNLASILGWYVAEGYRVGASGNAIAFGAGTDAQAETIQGLLSRFGNAYRNGRSVRIHSRELRDTTSRFGHLAENKFIPLGFKNKSSAWLSYFLDSAIDGDGHRYNSSMVYYTKSRKLAEDMCEIGIKIGYATGISKRKTWNPARTVLSESFIVRFSSDKIDIEKSNVSVEDYSGDVWCVKVPSGRVFIARNGRVNVTGQTMNLIGERQDTEKFIPKVISSVYNNKTVTVHGSPNGGLIGSRFYLHARNHADALLFITNNLPPLHFMRNAVEKPSRYNVRGEREIDNLDMAKMIASIMGKELRYELVDHHSTRPGHDPRYALDDRKLRVLGWVPPMALYDSLKKTVAWTLKNPEWLK